MTIKFSYVLPPQILQRFNSSLLITKTPKFRDSCETFEKMWKEALKLWKKIEHDPRKKARCEKLKQEILELYERTKIKEKERESQNDHKTQGFGYHVTYPQGLANHVLGRLKFGLKAGWFQPKPRRNYALSKAKNRD